MTPSNFDKTYSVKFLKTGDEWKFSLYTFYFLPSTLSAAKPQWGRGDSNPRRAD